MKKLSILLTIIACTLLSTGVSSETKGGIKEPAISSNDFQKLRDDIREVRRDQLNYQIEKNLLKETYSTNYQTTNFMISLALAIFAIMGYFGLKSISENKKEYINELDKLREIKNDFELKLKELITTQAEVKNKLSSIATINDEQNVKIKNIELKEKISNLMAKNEYQRALEYIALGLDTHKDDAELLSSKVGCFLRLGNHRAAIDTINKLLLIDSDNYYHTETLAELYLFVENVDAYDQIIKSKKDAFISDEDAVLEYLDALKHYVKNDLKSLRSAIQSCVTKHDLTATINLIAWDFRDLMLFIRKRKEDDAKKIFTSFTQYLDGKLTGQNLLKLLNKGSSIPSKN